MTVFLQAATSTDGFCAPWPRRGSAQRRLDPSAALRTGAALREDP
jgi:hypothetical protein